MGALLGARTALIERDRLGGECTWTGCVPSKTLLRAASVAHTLRHANEYGFAPVVPEVSFTGVFARLRAVQQQIYEEADAPPNMEKLGVEVVHGSALFTDPHTISVEGRTIRARYFIIATGSSPRRLGFEAPVLTNESIFDLRQRPRRLAIAGAGPLGLEMAQAFQRLGSAVTVIVSGAEVLPHDDQELAALLRHHLEAEGVRFVRQTRAVAALQSGAGIRVQLSTGETLDCDAVLAAVGREIRTEALLLGNAGVRTSEGRIFVDRHCRTSCRHIFAVGDVTGRQPFTHMAEHMAKVAVTNCILRWPASIDETVPWCTFTSPELAHTGCRTDGSHSRKSTLLRYPFRGVDRAVMDGQTDGLIKVLTDRRGHVLGASVLGPQAGELINIWSLAVKRGMRVQDVSNTIHPYPTYSLGNRRAADRWSERWLDSPLLGILGRCLGYRGARRGSGALERSPTSKDDLEPS